MVWWKYSTVGKKFLFLQVIVSWNYSENMDSGYLCNMLNHRLICKVACDSPQWKYKLKANHNKIGKRLIKLLPVIHHNENTNWKLITTTSALSTAICACDSPQWKYKLKANHNQKEFQFKILQPVIHHNENTNWKLITTNICRWKETATCDSPQWKYKLKANHNQLGSYHNYCTPVIHHNENTNWKLITTYGLILTKIHFLWFTTMKIQIES